VGLIEFVLSQLRPRSRVLEVGCGTGELARSLDRVGHDVLAIDPVAPEGRIFRRIGLEELDSDAGSFDAVVAARSLHHVPDLGAAVDKLARLAPLLVLDEFAWDRLDERTAEWYEGQRGVLVAAGTETDAEPVGDWEREHAGLHGYERMRAELDRRFVERHFEWMPYLYRYLGGPATFELEQGLIDAGAINGLGFRYIGVRSGTTRSSGVAR
jgi:SAM-dependent methyltransferase